MAERRSVAVPHMSGAEYPNRAVTVPTMGLMASCTNALEANRAPENGKETFSSTCSRVKTSMEG